MGKVDLYRIVFDNPMGTYYAGQTVTGKVVLQLKEEINLKGIFIHLQGKAYVSWSESESYYDSHSNSHKSRTVTRSDSQNYFDMKYPLQGTERIEKLQPGQFHYPFSIVLPINLPSSFEGSHGHIRYTCSSNISRPWRFDPKCKAAITVLEVVDLNTIPDAPMSSSKENAKNTGCCCCKSGTIIAAVSINKNGFVPGENIYISADINNSSDEAIRRTSATLYCWITYRAHHHTKRETKTICNVERGVISPRCRDQWTNQPLRIPSIPPTSFRNVCKVINMEYFLQFTIDPTGTFSTDLDFTFPITIGSIPLRIDFNTFIPYSPSAPPLPQPPPPLLDFGGEASAIPIPNAAFETQKFNDYPDLPPPSYEECVYGRVNIREDGDDHTTGELNFAPRYMYYNQTQPPPYH